MTLTEETAVMQKVHKHTNTSIFALEYIKTRNGEKNYFTSQEDQLCDFLCNDHQVSLDLLLKFRVPKAGKLRENCGDG